MHIPYSMLHTCCELHSAYYTYTYQVCKSGGSVAGAECTDCTDCTLLYRCVQLTVFSGTVWTVTVDSPQSLSQSPLTNTSTYSGSLWQLVDTYTSFWAAAAQQFKHMQKHLQWVSSSTDSWNCIIGEIWVVRSEICSRDHLRYSSYNEADSETQHKHVRCDTKVILFVMIAAAPWAEVSNIRYHRPECGRRCYWGHGREAAVGWGGRNKYIKFYCPTHNTQCSIN